MGLLNFAKQQGDVLIVAINSDSSIEGLKGDTRPIMKQNDRAIMLSAISMVDRVLIFDEPDPEYIVEKISPDVLVKGTDWSGAVIGQDWIESHGGRVVLMPMIDGLSTTDIIDKILTNESTK